ncbi:MAG: hypothetical protein GY863_21920, partial [bacterium]|nr:hypothetical protein [bacterium]
QNLWDSNNAADYLIISHEKFLSQANSYASYRQEMDNFPNGIKLVDVEDVYNQFNYGMKDPQAIRDFLTQTRNWSVMPSYVLLIGDASWDPKLNDPESEAVDYVPSYGYPASDAWFTLTDGEDDIIPDIYIGRFPVASTEEFENIFNKIQEYESVEPDEWQKKILFLNGGRTSFEQILLRSRAELIGNSQINAHPFSGNDVYFNKTSTNEIEKGFKEDIIREINEGALWVNSMGHASSEIYDVDFGTVDELSNTGLYPFMVSMSCNTGRFANPTVTSMAEKYTLAKDRGAIGYFATTGWGRINSDNVIIYDFFKNLFEEGIESLGEAMTLAKIRLYDYSTVNTQVNLVWQYSLMGDPALKLSMTDMPDFAMKEGDIVFEKDDPSANDSPLEVKVFIRNYGLSVEDSVTVELFDITDPQNPQQVGGVEYLYKNGYIDSTVFDYNLIGKSGSRTLKAVVNRTGGIEEYSTLNNEITEDVMIYITNAVPYFPQDLTTVNDRHITLKALVPKYRSADRTGVFFEVDTSSMFESPLFQSDAVPEGDVFTEYDVSLPAGIESDSPVYWRVRNNNNGAQTDWQESSFYIDTLLNDVVERWQQTGKTFETGTFVSTGLEDTSGYVTLQKQPVDIIVESAGFFDGLFHTLVLDGNEIESTPYDTTLHETLTQGIYIAQVDQKTGELLESYHFNTHISSDHSDWLASYINAIPSGRIVMAAVRDEASHNLTQGARDALKTIGSELIDDLEWRDSWAIIGEKGAQPGAVTEALNKSGEGRVEIRDSLMVYPGSGTFTSPTIKGASKWLSMSVLLDQETFIPENIVTTSLYGYNPDQGVWDKLFENEMIITRDLSGIDAKTYPELRLEVLFVSGDWNQTARLQSWSVEYESGNDYYTNADFVSLSADTVMQGGSLDLSGEIFRSIKGDIDTITVGITARNTGEKDDNYTGSLNVVFQETDSLKQFSFSVPTYGLSGSQEIIVEIDPDNDNYEISELNNLGVIPVFLEDDPLAPEIEITVDDRIVRNDDYVSDSPEILITITENSGHTISDTSLISLRLDNNPVDLVNNSLIDLTYDIENSKTDILYTPQLEHGEHTLSVAVADRNNNQTQTGIDFIVSSVSRIEEFFPIPNPFADKTYFTYKLTGNFHDVRIRIYTVRGRLIRTIDYAPVGAGFNRVEWDGRDQDGDLVANGVYLCRIIGRVDDISSVKQTKVAVIR